MWILVVDNSNLNIVHKYEADAPNQAQFGGPWGWPSHTTHIICSPAYDVNCVAVKEESGSLVAYLDDAKVAIMVEKQWEDLRTQRDVRLTECDWTQMPDSPLNSQDKQSWKTYRQALRDLPENTEDPANPEWPAKPHMQI